METKVNFGIKGIEIVNSVIKSPVDGRSISEFGFDIQFKTNPNLEDNTVTVLAEAVLRDFKKQDQIGQFSALFQFGVDDLAHVVIGNAPNQIEIPAPLLTSLLSISVSTLRGLMFSAFKGTFLHGAILPLIDVGALQHELIEPFAN